MTDVTYTTIPQMTAATDAQVADTTLMEVAAADSGDSSGYVSRKMTAAQLKTYAQGTLPAEVNQLKSDLNNKSNVIISSASGSIAHFEDGAEANAVSVIAHIEPVQDLHGYDSPWPAGGGKNKLVITAADIKALNDITWNDNVAVNNGITFTILEDAAGNVTGIQANGTASATIQINISKTDISQGIYYLSDEYYSSTAFIRGVFRDANGVAINIGGSVFTDLTIGEAYREVPSNVAYINIYININSGANVNNVIFRPMLRYSTESGTFAPYSNICPISGWTGAKVTRAGKNLYPAKIGRDRLANNVGATHTTDSDELVITMTASTHSGIYALTNSDLWKTINGVLVGSAYTYSFDIKSNTSGNIWCGTESNGAKIVAVTTDWQRVTISVSSGKAGSFVVYNRSNAARTVTVRNVQMELSSTATDYEPYQGETYTTDLGGTYYGGTLDVTMGKLTVDRAMIDMASITNWNIDKSAKRIYKVRSDIAPASAGNVVADGLICNRFPSITADQIYANVEGVVISTGSALQFRINGLTDDANVTLAMVNEYFANNSTTVVAKLATPIVYALDPVTVETLLGTNNIWSDTGDTAVEYVADTKLYIDRKFAELQALVLENLNA